MDIEHIIKQWLEEEKERGCYIQLDDELDNMTIDGSVDLDKLIKTLNVEFQKIVDLMM